MIESSTTGNGNAGIVTINASEGNINTDSQVSTASTGTGDASNISFLETNNFALNGGSQITSSSDASGNAGSIALNISDRL